MAGWLGKYTPYTKGIVHVQSGQNFVRIRKQGLTVAQRINDFFARYGNYVAIGMAIRFAEAAARFTPPNIGKATIDEKYYSRPIYSLTDLAKGLVRTPRGRRVHATKEDYEALRNGFKYKVVNTKYRLPRELKNKAVAYTKGINEAKRIAKIERRGLSKYSWGGMLNNVKQNLNAQIATGEKRPEVFTVSKLPNIFQRLARKSPAITKYMWGTYQWHFYPSNKEVKRISFTIENRLAEIQSYGSLAIRQGLNAARKYTNNLWKGVDVLAQDDGSTLATYEQDDQIAIRDLRRSMTRLFEDVTEKYQVNVVNFKQDSSVPEGQFQIRRS